MALSREQQDMIASLADAIAQTSASTTQQTGGGASASTLYTLKRDKDQEKRRDKINNDILERAAKDFRTAAASFAMLSKKENKNEDELSRQLKLSSTLVNEAMKSASSLNALTNSLPKHFEKAFRGIEDLQGRAFEVKSLEDVSAIEEYKREIMDATKALQDFGEGVTLSSEDANAAYDLLKQYGIDISDHMKHIGDNVEIYIADSEDLHAVQEELIKKTNELAEAQSKAAASFHTTDQLMQSMKNTLMGAVVPLKVFGNELREIERAGTYENGLFLANTAATMGLSLEELNAGIVTNRQVQFAQGKTQTQFIADVEAASHTLSNLSKMPIGAASKAIFQMQHNAGMFGVSQENLTNAIQKQSKIYHDNYRALGITTEQFNQMTNELVNDRDVQLSLAKMRETERQQYIEGIQLRQAEYLQMGFNIEQAKELTKTFAQLAGESPIERMKKAARTQAMMGALGMGNEGARMATLMRDLPLLQGDARAAAELEMSQLAAGASNALQQRMGSSLSSNLAFGMMSDKLGFQQQFGQFNTEVRKGTKFDEATSKRQLAAIEATPDALHKGLVIWDQMEKHLATSVGLLGVLAATNVGGALGLKGAFGRGSDAAAAAGKGSWASRLAGAGALGKALIGTGSVVGGGLLVGKDMIDLAGGDTSKGNTGALIGSALGGLAGAFAGPVGMAVGATLGNTVGEAIGNWLDSDDEDESKENARQMKADKVQEGILDEVAKANELNQKMLQEQQESKRNLEDAVNSNKAITIPMGGLHRGAGGAQS